MTPSERGPSDGRSGADWQRPRVEAPGLQRYLQTLRERWGMIVVTVLVTMLAAGAYVATANKVYEADADLLITPISGDDPELTGLPLLRESNDPTRDVETAARLVTTRDVATRVRNALRLDTTPERLLDDVEAQPVAQSNIVNVKARADSPVAARDLANGFANGLVQHRDAELRAQIGPRAKRLRERIAAGEAQAQSGADPLPAQLGRLESLGAGGDPTIRVETRAAKPTSPVSPRPLRTIVAALFAGLLLGVGGAFALQALDPRLRREEQLRELYSLPILARIPRERKARTSTLGRRRFLLGPRRKRRRALAPGQLSPTTMEAFRTLRTMLAASRGGRTGRSVLVTGPSPSEGKTTTAINLASSFALAGNRVILIEADFRRPTVGEALGVRTRIGIGKVLLGNATLEEALVPAKPFGDNLRLLIVDRADDWLAEVLSLPTARSLLEEAERLADYVVVDSPPLTEVIDALPLAQQVDDVALVVRLGASKLSQLERLGHLLAHNDITPSGFVLVGVGNADETSYYLTSRRERAEDDWLMAAEEPHRQPLRSVEP
jgi:tyrosine-protein kinase